MNSFFLPSFLFRLPFVVWAACSICLALISSTANAQSPADPAFRQFLNTKELQSAHVGVYVYDDSSKKIIADFQSDKYFIPASNVKIFTLYAGMKYLGDSLLGLRYLRSKNGEAVVIPTGDPSLLHPDFQSQPVVDFLKTCSKITVLPMAWQEIPLGKGWAWDDYNDDYSTERSPMPVYGNVIRWNQQITQNKSNPVFGQTASVSSSPEIPWPIRFSKDSKEKNFGVQRLVDSNVFVLRLGTESEASMDVPFVTNGTASAIELLKDSIGRPIAPYVFHDKWESFPPPDAFEKIYSRPVDSVFMPMMYRSDNFFAEQTLLMVSDRKLGLMKDAAIIDTLLAGALADLPQKPSWVDGCGLSRYNLFSPRDFVSVLIKMKNEFGMERMRCILPTGGSGTLKNYYRADSGYVFAKTGSMSGVMCLSGYVYTNKKHLLEFSILINNNYQGNTAIKRAVEAFVESLRKDG